MSVLEIFEKHNDEYMEFEKIPKSKRDKFKTKRPDLFAFLMLDELFPNKKEIINDADNEIIFLNITNEEIETLQEDDIIELIRCGVCFDTEYDCLYINC